MKCPKCNTDMNGNNAPVGQNVIETRAVPGNNAIRRRRECQQCKHRFTTYEYIGGVPSTLVAELNDVLDSGMVALVRAVEKMRAGAVGVIGEEASQAPEAEGTDRPQRELESGEVDGAVGVGSSR
jgi:transcriptional repressor NrdR